MKNVLVLTTTFPRWRNDTTPSFVFTLSGLLAKKYNITVLAPHAYNAAKNENMGSLKVRRFKYFFPGKFQKIAYGAGMLPNVKKSILAKMQLPGFLASQISSAKKIIGKEKIGMMHAHWLVPSGLIAALLKKRYNMPLIITIHGSDLFPLKSRFFRALQQYAVKNADLITINSKIAQNELVSRFPKIKNKVKVISMGIDTDIFRPKNVKYKKYRNNRIIIFVGRLNEQKGVECLIMAMPDVISREKNAKLLIIGEGNHKKHLEKIINELKLGNFTEFLGSKNHAELADYYNLADVIVLPSVTGKTGTEALGLVLIEAMACGTCVIGSSSGGIKEIIKDNVNGLIFQEKNSKELAHKIIKVLKDSKLRERLGKNGLIYARQNYKWDKISNKFLELYGKLLK